MQNAFVYRFINYFVVGFDLLITSAQVASFQSFFDFCLLGSDSGFPDPVANAVSLRNFYSFLGRFDIRHDVFPALRIGTYKGLHVWLRILTHRDAFGRLHPGILENIVYSLAPLKDGDFLKLSISELYTPSFD